jgi:hypothetical protein
MQIIPDEYLCHLIHPIRHILHANPRSNLGNSSTQRILRKSMLSTLSVFQHNPSMLVTHLISLVALVMKDKEPLRLRLVLPVLEVLADIKRVLLAGTQGLELVDFAALDKDCAFGIAWSRCQQWFAPIIAILVGRGACATTGEIMLGAIGRAWTDRRT